MNNRELEIKAYNIRKNAVTAVYSASSGHPGGSLSSADLMAVLYFDEMNIDPKNPKPDFLTRRSLRPSAILTQGFRGIPI